MNLSAVITPGAYVPFLTTECRAQNDDDVFWPEPPSRPEAGHFPTIKREEPSRRREVGGERRNTGSSCCRRCARQADAHENFRILPGLSASRLFLGGA